VLLGFFRQTDLTAISKATQENPPGWLDCGNMTSDYALRSSWNSVRVIGYFGGEYLEFPAVIYIVTREAVA